MSGTPPRCGAQTSGTMPGSFDWWLFGGILFASGAGILIYANGVPLANQILNLILGYSPMTGASDGPLLMTASAAGALAVLILVGSYLLKADGCVVSKPKSQTVCASGIIEDVVDLNSPAINILAPYAIGPEAMFDVVVKSTYWSYVTSNASWVFCSAAGAAMLPCFVKSATSCAARWGSAIGAALGAIGGVVLGYLAGAAVASLACGIFAPVCFLLALIVAAIVAALVTYAAADIGGLVGEGIAAASDDSLGDNAKSLVPGIIVTVVGDLTLDPDVGNNELFYVNSINRTGQFNGNPSYTTANADDTPLDDCPVNPSPPK